ncbi:hypothetical protein LX36DRAFT_713643 [Colletotrichum falcatum]|nr:hypothetical protein LX36DRAFT_713643 [Colletotrichum falcatum]
MWYVLEAFPQAVRDMAAGVSIVAADFEPGEAWDVERLVEEHGDRAMREWKGAWSVRGNNTFDLDPSALQLDETL